MKHTPKEAVRAMCIDCLGLMQFNSMKIMDCQGDTAQNRACPLFPYRMGKRVSVKLFRKYCLYCTGNSREYIENCQTKTCALYPYRFGKNPAMFGRPARGITKTVRLS